MSRPSGSIRRHELGESGLGLHRGRPDTDRHRHPSGCPIRPGSSHRISPMLPPRLRTRKALLGHSHRPEPCTAPRSWLSCRFPFVGSIFVGWLKSWVFSTYVGGSHRPHSRPRPRRLECPSRAMITWSWTAIPSSPHTSTTCLLISISERDGVASPDG